MEAGNEIWSLAVSPDGQKLASAGWSLPVQVRNARTGLDGVEFPDFRTIVFCVKASRRFSRQKKISSLSARGLMPTPFPAGRVACPM